MRLLWKILFYSIFIVYCILHTSALFFSLFSRITNLGHNYSSKTELKCLKASKTVPYTILVYSQDSLMSITQWRCKYVQMYSVSERVRRGRWSPTTESEAMTISPLPEDWSPVMGPEEVIVTDITINSLTVTFREALVARGFFRSWEMEIWHYRDWGWSKRGGKIIDSSFLHCWLCACTNSASVSDYIYLHY